MKTKTDNIEHKYKFEIKSVKTGEVTAGLQTHHCSNGDAFRVLNDELPSSPSLSQPLIDLPLLYLAPSEFSSPLKKLKSFAKTNNLHNMILPPPCFSVGMVCSACFLPPTPNSRVGK